MYNVRASLGADARALCVCVCIFMCVCVFMCMWLSDSACVCVSACACVRVCLCLCCYWLWMHNYNHVRWWCMSVLSSALYLYVDRTSRHIPRWKTWRKKNLYLYLGFSSSPVSLLRQISVKQIWREPKTPRRNTRMKYWNASLKNDLCMQPYYIIA